MAPFRSYFICSQKSGLILSNYYYLYIVRRLPNILSTIRIILTPIFLFLYVQDEVVWRALSVGIFAVAVVTDFFDGYLARLYGAQTPFGVFIDPLADKFLTFAGFICLPFIDPAQFPWWAVGVIVFRDVFVTALRMLAEHRGERMKTRMTAKVKTMGQMVFLYLTLLVGVFIEAEVWLSSYSILLLESGVLGWMMMGIVILTLYSGFEYLYYNKNILGFTHHAKTKTDPR